MSTLDTSEKYQRIYFKHYVCSSDLFSTQSNNQGSQRICILGSSQITKKQKKNNKKTKQNNKKKKKKKKLKTCKW